MNKRIPKTPSYTGVWGPGGGVLKYEYEIQIEMFECTEGIELYTDSIP